LKKTLNNLFENGVTEEELEVTKTNLKASFLRNNETKEERARSIGFLEALGLGYEFLNRLFEEVDAASLEEMNTFIKDILNPEKGIEIIVGPKIENKNQGTEGSKRTRNKW
jgi:zinc protease